VRRPISRKQHGFVDYSVAALELCLMRVLAPKPTTRLLLGASGVNAAVLAGLTKYELGIAKLIPMRLHLALDGVFAATFVGAAAFVRDRAAVRATLAALGATGATAAALTDPDRA
jgi:hypothetical protein